jgi:hypothetical protein
MEYQDPLAPCKSLQMQSKLDEDQVGLKIKLCAPDLLDGFRD